MNLLVTGGCGFIGANFILYWMREHSEDRVVNVDLCTYAAVKENLQSVEKDSRYCMIKADIADYKAMEEIVKKYGIDYIVNFAAESHNSNSIIDPTAFYRTNIIGLQTLMEVVRHNKKVQRIHHISTCEVYGDLALDSEIAFDENYPLGGNSPWKQGFLFVNILVKMELLIKSKQ